MSKTLRKEAQRKAIFAAFELPASLIEVHMDTNYAITNTSSQFGEMPVMTKRTEHSIPEFQRLLAAQPIDNPIYSMTLEAELNLTGSEIRAIISHLRVNAIPPFIGSGNNGYFHARKAEDLDSTVDQIEGRITRLQRVAKGLKLAQVRLRCGDTQTDMQI